MVITAEEGKGIYTMEQGHNQFIFQEEKEVERLHVQDRLLSPYEDSVFDTVFSGKSELSVLDVGSNDGSKTVHRFGREAVSKVIGLEYNEVLAKEAQGKYGNDRFSFYSFDVEDIEFNEKLSSILKKQGVERFDIIYMSLVLMHLSDMKTVLSNIRPYLKEDGILVIVEGDDPVSVMEPDEDGILGEFLEILDKDKYSGNRKAGSMVCKCLGTCGYKDIHVWHEGISAGKGEVKKKKDIFETFFSYFPEDVELLLEEEPENEEYQNWSAWLKGKYQKLKDIVTGEDSTISMGIKIVSCRKDEEDGSDKGSE